MQLVKKELIFRKTDKTSEKIAIAYRKLFFDYISKLKISKVKELQNQVSMTEATYLEFKEALDNLTDQFEERIKRESRLLPSKKLSRYCYYFSIAETAPLLRIVDLAKVAKELN